MTVPVGALARISDSVVLGSRSPLRLVILAARWWGGSVVPLLALVLCFLRGVHEIIFPLWVLAPGLLLHLRFSPYRHLVTCRKSLRTREGSGRAQAAACWWGQLQRFFSTACCHFEVCRRRGPSSSLQRVFPQVLLLLVPSGPPVGGGGVSPLTEIRFVLQLADQGLVRFPLLSQWVCPEQLLRPSKGKALHKMKLRLHRNWAFFLMNNKHQKHEIVQSGYCISLVS